MAVMIKCKMCGGDLLLTEGSTVATCEYCGTQQTVPTQDNEKKLVQFERADRLRRNCEFDKAAGVYESIVADFRQEAEGYWGLVLCKYGIEYVDDPASGKKVPTCHRSSFESVMDDPNFEQTLENADAVSRKVYREEAKKIEEIRKGIIEVSAKEDPYDIFICYKETAEDGQRTVDSVMAQDIYEALTDKGYRVFFSRITLEDKLGQEYEPYIFAALNSAKVMLAIGTDYEHYNAVWVKNEWSRYLKLMEGDKSKHLIPCFKGIDAYDMPKEFNKLQAQDLGKVGATQDLLRGIDKLIAAKPAVQQAAGVQSDDVNRIYIYNSAMEDMKSKKVKKAKEAVKKLESLGTWGDAAQQLENAKKHLKKRKRARATRRIITWVIILGIIGGIAGFILNKLHQQKLEKYESGISYMEDYKYYDAYRKFNAVPGFQDADALAAEAKEKMYAMSDAIKAVKGDFRSPELINYMESYFALSPHVTNFDGEELYTDLSWEYVGLKTELDIFDPASLAQFTVPDIKAMIEAGELMTDLYGTTVFNPQTGEIVLHDEKGNTYQLHKDDSAGTVTVSGGEVFGSGKTFYADSDIMNNAAMYTEYISMAFSVGMKQNKKIVLEGDVSFDHAFIYYKGEPVIEEGICVVDSATGDAYISGGDPGWMLKCTPNGTPEEGNIDAYTIEVVGNGCPFDITGTYQVAW